jgi:hypothetical protein
MFLDQQAAGYFDSVYSSVTGHEALETDVFGSWADEPRQQEAEALKSQAEAGIGNIAPAVLHRIGEAALVANSDQQPLITAA